MPEFSYHAIDPNGREKKGRISAGRSFKLKMLFNLFTDMRMPEQKYRRCKKRERDLA